MPVASTAALEPPVMRPAVRMPSLPSAQPTEVSAIPVATPMLDTAVSETPTANRARCVFSAVIATRPGSRKPTSSRAAPSSRARITTRCSGSRFSAHGVSHAVR